MAAVARQVNGIWDIRNLAIVPPNKGWLPYVVDVKPTPSASQVVSEDGPVNISGTVHETFSLRAKTTGELDADKVAADSTLIRNALTIFDAGTATNAQIQRAIAWLIRQARG